MKSRIHVFVALFAFVFAQNSLACDSPAKIKIPNGKKATAIEMAEAGEKYHQFMLDNQLYQACLEEEAKSERRNARKPSRSDVDTRENKYIGLHNAASAAMKKATRGFQKAVEDYEARQ